MSCAEPFSPSRVFDLLPYQQSNFPKADAFAYKAGGVWKKFSTNESIEIIDKLAWGLHLQGVRSGDRVASVSDNNRPEWNFLDNAVLSLGAIHVPIYPNIAPEEYKFILKDSDASLIFCSSQRLYELLRPVIGKLSSIKEVYVFDAVAGAKSWSDLVSAGKEVLERAELRDQLIDFRATVKPNDLAVLIYTSGTTGPPKGVMLSHRNLISNCITSSAILGSTPHDRALSFLPLCHIYERTVVNLYIFSGTSVYYAENLDQIGQNLREVQPQIFSAVPRIIEKIYEKILARGEQLSGIKHSLFFWALNLGLNYDPDSRAPWLRQLQLLLADRLIFKKWRESVGGNIRGVISGSAALQPKLARLFWAAGIPIYEGYGPTEAAPVISVNQPHTDLHRIGTVGPVIPDGEVKIAEDGEILYRGPNVMLGYYNRPDLTIETIDSDGWLHTGDVGEFDGPFLKITDRKKEIFKTSGGKYIAPQQIENRLKESRFISQCIVIGENRKFPSALIVPEFSALKSWSETKGLSAMPPKEFVKDPQIIALYAGEIERCNQHFGRYSQIKKFAVLPEEWTIATGELTPTLKIKRKITLQKYAAEVEALYSGEEPGKTSIEKPKAQTANARSSVR
ncbi:MAG TPA: long-chain fatty acid--CoA ligase [Chthoniobacterales bacterium]|nr:long-chain fatty acid--CoA ligase [Chthoniobacterales bacterium]